MHWKKSFESNDCLTGSFLKTVNPLFVMQSHWRPSPKHLNFPQQVLNLLFPCILQVCSTIEKIYPRTNAFFQTFLSQWKTYPLPDLETVSFLMVSGKDPGKQRNVRMTNTVEYNPIQCKWQQNQFLVLAFATVISLSSQVVDWVISCQEFRLQLF